VQFRVKGPARCNLGNTNKKFLILALESVMKRGDYLNRLGSFKISHWPD
jgi:hypothetical protein